LIISSVLAASCGSAMDSDGHGDAEHSRKRGHDRDGEHGGREHGGEHGGGDEEDGTEYALGASCDMTRRGAHLTLAYEASSGAFVGFVENVSDKPLAQVRVEVHLSNGLELGPTDAKDLAVGGKVAVKLDARGQTFERWTAHPEVGRDEHGREGGEHGGR